MEAYSQSIKTLIEACEHELEDLEYDIYKHRKVSKYWAEFSKWMETNGIELFTVEIGSRYCFEEIGSDVLSGIDRNEQLRLRSIRMLISYHRDGCFEFRTPSIAPRVFQGETGMLMEAFLEKTRAYRQLAESTISEKRLRLHEFNSYLEKLGITLDEVNTQTIIDFTVEQNYSLTKKRQFSITIKHFLRYAYDIRATINDLSFMVMPVSKGPQKLPDTYTEDEIRRILSVVERGAAIGKRDYVVLLLAAEYGWRASDIASFQFDWVDWEKNTITFNQQKTGTAVQYPLLASVGNAIIDYLKYGRPDTDAQEIIVGHDTMRRGKKLATPTIHSIVTKYFRTAKIENRKQKKHGPHALRFSLATNLLKRNTSLPVISTILGHQCTESTKQYISLDIDQLRKCALPIPPLNTDIFEVAI